MRGPRGTTTRGLVLAIVLVFLGPASAAIATPVDAVAKTSASTAAKQTRLANRALRLAAREAAKQQRLAARAQRQAEAGSRRATKPKISTEVAGIVVTTIPASIPRAQTIDPARLQTVLDEWTRSRPDLASMSVAVRHAGQSWSGSSANGGAPAPDPLARFRVLSVTKTMTAALVFRAIESGRLSLDAPLPEITGLGVALPPGLTVRHLLAHRSGFVEYSAAPGYRSTELLSARGAVELTLRAGLASSPGTVTAYANSNYLYLGLLLEQVEGRPYGDLVAGLVGSLGLVNTRVEPADRPGWPAFSSGGVVSTTADIAAWGEALLTPGSVVSTASLAEMKSFDGDRAGLGLWGYCPCPIANGAKNFRAVGHHTATGGLFVFESEGFVVMMKAGTDGGDTTERAMSFAAALRNAKL
jgi:CubicO group peptidase (beta-lactamase class C family)